MSKNCRFCNSKLNTIFIDLGKLPLANSYLKENEFDDEKFYPLCAYVCNDCFLVQLEEIEKAENIFSDYAYFSSYSTSWLKHSQNYVEMITSKLNLTKDNLVIEIASNDGYLLQNFLEKNIPVLGIEPARNVANSAIEKNIPTIIKFFNSDLASKLVSEGKQADLIIGNNVLAHVPCLNDFIKGLKKLLKPNGIITLEVPHLLQLMKNRQFDTIYHEHFSYFSLITLKRIFEEHGFKIFDVEEIPTHGGSLRLYIIHQENTHTTMSENVSCVIGKEKNNYLDNISTYEKFNEEITKLKSNLVNLITEIRSRSKKIICYGAPAKGNTLLNYCNISKDMIEYTVDKNPNKQNLFLPGTHIPIFSPQKFHDTKPDFVLILPWNLQDEIVTELEFIKDWGGQFIIPIPEVKIIQ